MALKDLVVKPGDNVIYNGARFKKIVPEKVWCAVDKKRRIHWSTIERTKAECCVLFQRLFNLQWRAAQDLGWTFEPLVIGQYQKKSRPTTPEKE